MPAWLKNILLIYVSYLGFCLFFVQALLNLAPAWFLDREYQRQLDTKIVYFNPFTNGVVAHEVALDNPDRSPFFSFQRAEVNLSLSSIWSKGWVLNRVQLSELDLAVTRDETGAFNFDDFLTGEEAPPVQPSGEEAGIPGVTIHELDLSSRRIALEDRSREDDFSAHFDALAVYVTDLSTVLVEGKPYSLKARGEAGGELHWEGLVSVPESSSEGRLKISNLSLAPAARFIAPWVDFDIPSAALSIDGDYRVNWGGELAYQVSQGRVTLADLQIVPAADQPLADTRLELGSLEIAGIELSSDGNATVDSVVLNQPIIEGWSEGDQVSLLTLLSTDGLPAAEETASTDEDSEAIEWRATIGSTRISDGELRWRSDFTSPPTTEVLPINAELGEVNWPFSGTTPAELDLAINGQTNLHVDGALALASGDGQFNFKLAGIQLPWAGPAVPEAFQATIDTGDLSGEGSLSLAEFGPQQLTMDGSIRELGITIRGKEEALTGWEALHLESLDVDFDKQYIGLDTLRLVAYRGRLHIYADGSINTSAVLQQELDKADVDVDEAAEAAQAWNFDVRSIQVSDSQLDFMDESLPIVFRTIIGSLGGEVTGLSSDPGKSAAIDFAGSVDDYAPVTLGGNARPMASPPALDLGLGFKGLDLARLTPYSGTYAGYAIDRGVMTLNVKYTLEDNRLVGDNKLVIDQLKLGEKIESDKAVDIPLELGIALLTDANGVIDLSVPVSGNVDDPSFSLGSVISGAFINLITKAATAPFKLLAGLVGSEEDLQRVNFPAGSAELDPLAQEKLSKLAEAFQQRPELTLLIDGRINPELDRVRLQKNALAAELMAEGISEDQVKSKGPDWEAAIEKRYAATGQPLTDEAGQPLSIRKRYEAVARTMPIPGSALQTLAEERAVETKRFLVNEAGLESDRSAIDSVDLSEEAHTFSGVEMDVD